jgi:hypothetical protein
MAEKMTRYNCAVVETQPGRFVVAYPGDVDPGGRYGYKNISSSGIGAFYRDEPRLSSPGKYAHLPHLDIGFVEGPETFEQFRENVAAVVNRLMAESSGQPVTLEAIKSALPEPKYQTRIKTATTPTIPQIPSEKLADIDVDAILARYLRNDTPQN